jgi:hypothetical protein
MDLYEELVLLVTALDRAGMRYAVCGGLAVAIHGHPRLTKDIDILVHPDDEARTLELAESAGFNAPSLPMEFGARTDWPMTVTRVSRIEGDDVLSLDVIRAAGWLAPILQQHASAEWEDRRIPVVSRRGLSLMKRVANRPQDRADLEVLGLDVEEDPGQG